MKAILVATDFSRNAFNAAKYAFALAEEYRLSVTLYHSHPVMYPDPEVPFADMEMQAKALIRMVESEMYKLIQKLRKLFPGVRVKWKIDIGVPKDNIINYIRYKRIKTLVVGTTGQNGLAKAVLGSTTEFLIRYAPCNIIIVPRAARYRPIRRITFATDLKPDNLNAMTCLVPYARKFRAGIMFVHIQDSSSFAGEDKYPEMMKAVQRKTHFKHVSFQIVTSPQVDGGLRIFARKGKSDMLAMATHRTHFPSSLWKTSWTRIIANYTTIPLFVIHINKAGSPSHHA